MASSIHEKTCQTIDATGFDSVSQATSRTLSSTSRRSKKSRLFSLRVGQLEKEAELKKKKIEMEQRKVDIEMEQRKVDIDIELSQARSAAIDADLESLASYRSGKGTHVARGSSQEFEDSASLMKEIHESVREEAHVKVNNEPHNSTANVNGASLRPSCQHDKLQFFGEPKEMKQDEPYKVDYVQTSEWYDGSGGHKRSDLAWKNQESKCGNGKMAVVHETPYREEYLPAPTLHAIQPNSIVQQCLPHQPQVSNYELSDALYCMASSITQGQHSIPKFDGDAMDFHRFMSNFDDVYGENERLTPTSKLKMLVDLCTGKAKKAIYSCTLIKPPLKAYENARKNLRDQFGQEYKVVNSYMKLLREGPEIKAGDSEALYNLATEMHDCNITMTQWGYSSNLNNHETIDKVFLRLPGHMQYEFQKRSMSLYDHGKEPMFLDLLEYIQQTAKLANPVEKFVVYATDLWRGASAWRSFFWREKCHRSRRRGATSARAA